MSLDDENFPLFRSFAASINGLLSTRAKVFKFEAFIGTENAGHFPATYEDVASPSQALRFRCWGCISACTHPCYNLPLFFYFGLQCGWYTCFHIWTFFSIVWGKNQLILFLGNIKFVQVFTVPGSSLCIFLTKFSPMESNQKLAYRTDLQISRRKCRLKQPS